MAAEQQAGRLSFGVSQAFGVGAIASGALSQALGALALLFYNQVVGLSPAMVGLALMLSLTFDAVCDPLIGMWSDNTRSKLGRRHPFMYAAIIPSALFFYLLWTPPVGLTETQGLAWLLGMLLPARFFCSLYEVPSTALAPELAPGYHARTGLLGLRYFWGVLAALIVTLLAFQGFLAERNGGVANRAGYAAFGVAGAALIGVTLLISCLGTHRRAAAIAAAPAGRLSFGALAGEVRGALANPNFVALIVYSLFGSISFGLTASLTTYFNLYLWGLSTDQISLLAAPALIASAVGVGLAPVAARKWGKKPAALGLSTAVVLVGALPMALRLVGVLPGNNWPWLMPLLAAETFLATTAVLMVMILSTSMLADVVDDSAVRSGRRSEGLFFAVNSLLAKSVSGLGAFGAGLMLSAVHFPQHALPGQVSQETVHALGFIFMPTALVLTAISLFALSRFRIDQATHEANLDRLHSLGVAHESLGEPHTAA